MDEQSAINIGVSTYRTRMQITDTTAIGSSVLDFDGGEEVLKSNFVATHRFEFDDEHRQTFTVQDIVIKELRAQEKIYGIWVDLPITLRNINGIKRLTLEALDQVYYLDVTSDILNAMSANPSLSPNAK